jgi:type IV pilus assembly protein PilW
MNRLSPTKRQAGVTLIELLVTMAITLFLVAAAAYVYLATRETQRAIDGNSANTEVGTFALHLIGEQIMMAGYYPANISRILTTDETFPKITTYPPTAIVGNNASPVSDWVAPATTPVGIYAAGIFGCDGADFLPVSGKCGDPTNGPDSIVINYFTNDNLGANTGHRMDCAGGNVDRDPSNVNRLNVANPAGPPLQPLFVSNRFTIRETLTEIDQRTVRTFSLACNGNGIDSPSDAYQPLLAGIEDLQITYGIFAVSADTKSRTAQKFYTAEEIKSDLAPVAIDTGLGGDLPVLSPWARVSAVRLCIMTRSQVVGVKISDGAGRPYVDCNGNSKQPEAGDTTLHKRFVQVFVVRNKMNQVY